VYNAGHDREELENSWTPLFEGKIVVASQVGTGAADVAPVPTDNNFPLSGVHANVLNTILTENFLQEFSPLQMFIVESFLVVLIYFLALKLSSRKLWVGAMIVLVGYLVGGTALFLYLNVIVNIIRPTLIIVFSVLSVMAYRYIVEEQQKEALRSSFESYLPPSIVNRMLANPESIFAGKKEELTILFSDIKSFTTYSSTMSPDEIQAMLNEYFEEMVNIVFKYEGTVDKYIGDGLMVFFGAPEPQPDHALRCVRAAIEMQKKCRDLKKQWEAKGWFPLKVRVGVNTGPVVVGNMGSARKLSYTVLGAEVNLANRLESNAPVEGIMISKRTYELVQGKVPTRPHGPVLVKGLDTPIEVYEVLVDESAPAS
jgi:adenylate cyclase